MPHPCDPVVVKVLDRNFTDTTVGEGACRWYTVCILRIKKCKEGVREEERREGGREVQIPRY